MNQPKLLELAKQGDVKAIASVLNYLLQDKGITAKAHLKDGCLQVMLESAQAPKRESSVEFIRKLMVQLEVKSIKSVKIIGKQTEQNSAAWIESLDLADRVPEPQKNARYLERLKQGDLQAITDLWPAWFPYPSSWCKALILVPIAFPVARFIFIAFAGIILSAITSDRGLLIILVVFGLILPTLFLSFLHHLLWFRWKYPISSSRRPKWLPSSNSLWSGFYATIVIGFSFFILIAASAGLSFVTCNLSNNTSEEVARCTGRLTGIAARTIFCMTDNISDFNTRNNFTQESSFKTKFWFISWLSIASYLYQFKHLIRHILIPRIQVLMQKHKLGKKNTKNSYYFDVTDVEFDNLCGEIGLTQVKKGKANFPSLRPVSQNTQNKNRKLIKKLVIFFLIPLVAISIYWSPKWLPLQEAIHTPVSQVSSGVQSEQSVITPLPISEAPAPLPQSDPFQQAVNNAMSAAKLAQTAKSKDDWNTIASQWQEAIALMKAVPTSHLNYAVAQKKVVEYQRNLDYARLAVSRSK